MTTSLIVFDCDSTLSAIEGVDELARLRGAETLAAVEAMTNDAMEGRIAVEAIFGRRLEIIRPRREDVVAVGRRYLETIEPTAIATIATLKGQGWTPVIVSGGFRQAIEPLAAALGIARIEAVDLYFDDRGDYREYDRAFPTARSGGKPEIMTRLRSELAARRSVMVGDGVSDLEAKPACDLFVGFGRYVQRARVRQEAGAWITSLAELPTVLARELAGK